jgi:Hydantoin racemase
MPKTLALIHTTKLFLTSDPIFQQLCSELLPDVQIINILDDSLLPHCMAEQRVTPALTRRMCSYVVAAEMAGADAVLSLCSSLGPTIDVARKMVSIPVIKIDDAHTEKAVCEARRIGVLATVASTLGPTVALIHEKAELHRKEVEVEEILVENAFEALTAGNRETHDALLLEAAARLAPKVDLLLFAQASMTRLAAAAHEATGLPVLTSPRPAIEYVRRVLNEGVRR